MSPSNVPPEDQPTARAEKRKAARHSAAPDLTCQWLAGPGAEPNPVRIQNLSEGGMNFYSGRPVPVGKLVTVELVNLARTFSCRRKMRVLYTLKQEDGTFSVGGCFSERLGREELRRLCSPPADRPEPPPG